MNNRMSIYFDRDPIREGHIVASWHSHHASGPTMQAALMSLTIYLEAKGLLAPAEVLIRSGCSNEL